MFKKFIFILTLPFVILLVAYLYGVYQNNREVAYPQKFQLEEHLEKSIDWLVNNEAEILSQKNPMLWWMLYEAQVVSADERIAGLIEKYMQQNRSIRYSVWGPLFDGDKHRNLGAYSVQGLPYYNQHFIYTLNCAKGISDDLAIVTQQNSPEFCHQSDYFYRPACITHQLMGINFLFTMQCGFVPELDKVTQSLQQDIITQLTFDIRVVDVYLQRVLMLLITGAEASVKPVWIQQVLDHQLDDGGWSNFVALWDGPGRVPGFSAKVISLGQEKSDFHATAQGVYILTYLLAGE